MWQRTSPHQPTSSAADRPVGALKLKDSKVIEFNGDEQHSGLGADWYRSSTNLMCRYIRFRHLILWYKTKSTDWARWLFVFVMQPLNISSISRIEDFLPTTTAYADPWRISFAVNWSCLNWASYLKHLREPTRRVHLRLSTWDLWRAVWIEVRAKLPLNASAHTLVHRRREARWRRSIKTARITESSSRKLLVTWHQSKGMERDTSVSQRRRRSCTNM